MSRPVCITFLGLLLVLPPLEGAVERASVDHAHVRSIAEQRARQPHRADQGRIPAFFREMTYDDYRRIRFVPESALWRAESVPYRVEFFHAGYLFRRSVRVHEFTDTHVQPVPFSVKAFDYQDLNVPFFSRWGLGFAGFKLLHPLNEPGKWDELVSFIGASYFRALGKGQRYGISARGLAINSGGPAPEEFPEFTEFWLGKPAGADAQSFTLHALLEGPSVTGAYTFELKPGDDTIVDVRTTLYFRQAVETAGLAPMTSMFWYGEGSPSRYGDFRPEVHDSDGLLVAPEAGTRLWRPLQNVREVRRTDFAAPALAGFGLLQRDRDFRSYEDIEGRYELRPSLWMEPVGEWPAGKVRLVELTANDEYHDNIVAYWTPDTPPEPGRPLELAWRLKWTRNPTWGGPPGWVRATRQTVALAGPRLTKFVVDFDLPGEAQPGPGTEVTAEIAEPPGARVVYRQVVRNDVDLSYRLIVHVEAAEDAGTVELRARLLAQGQPLTETWVYPWTP